MKYIKMLLCIIMIFVGVKYNTKDVNIWLCLMIYSWVDCIFSKDWRVFMQTYKSKVFYHRDELTDFLNETRVYVVNISWIGNCWVLFYFN